MVMVSNDVFVSWGISSPHDVSIPAHIAKNKNIFVFMLFLGNITLFFKIPTKISLFSELSKITRYFSHFFEYSTTFF